MLPYVDSKELKLRIQLREKRAIEYVRKALVGSTIVDAAEKLGVSRMTIYAWMRAFPELAKGRSQ